MFILIALTASLNSVATELYTEFPTEVKPDERYVIYSHGLTVEGDDPRPKHPKFGIYEFVKIKKALFQNGNFNLIAHHRPANTDIDAYVEAFKGCKKRAAKTGS